MENLIRWKDSDTRKPLILRGARQTGKTWLMKEFGSRYYKKTVYINFEQNKRLKQLFEPDLDIRRIIIALQAESGMVIDPSDTLLIFDEVQSLPEALTSLKYFCELAPEYHVIAAGSLLGTTIHTGSSFPVGKVNFLDLHPLTFNEFLDACGQTGLSGILSGDDWKLISTYGGKAADWLRTYYYVGGMPEAVLQFSENHDFREVRDIHNQILNSYEQDFSKYPPSTAVPRIRMLWNSIPSQIGRENRKFIYGLVKEGARAKDYETSLSWLEDCGHIHRVNRVAKPGFPLKAYADMSSFKIFTADVGLLSSMCDIDSRSIFGGNKMFTEFKGALTEQYVLQQLISAGDYSVYYWSADRATAEIDFVIQHENTIIPVEVKAEENLHAKSVKVYYEKFLPELAVRTSMSDYRKHNWLINIPLYALGNLRSIIESQIDHKGK